MNISQIYDDLSMFEYRLARANQEYASYVKKAGWSDEICYRVDVLQRNIAAYEQEIEAIHEILYWV
jgi:hypothetical protein